MFPLPRVATGLREHELASLEVGDVFEVDGGVKAVLAMDA